ncbi:MAG TPA: hypothetical protein VF173_22475 [Thermoanaerobaculia bacterium]|nr:hypothetical protein [Thermoanaerobaculia bacterium]
MRIFGHRGWRLVPGLLLAWGIAGAPVSGTPAARPAHDAFPGEADLPPAQLTRLGSVLFFVAADADEAPSVWRTDGTAAGTLRVPTLGDPVPGGGDVRILGQIGQSMVWTARVPGTLYDRVLFSATESGPRLTLGTYSPAPPASNTRQIDTPQIIGDRLFFQNCPPAGCRIWSTDGTTAGTGPVSALAQLTATDQAIMGSLAGKWLVIRSRQAVFAYDLAADRVLSLLPQGAQFVEIHPVGETLFLVTRTERSKLWASRLGSPRAAQLFSATTLDVAGWRGDLLYFAPDGGRLWATDGQPKHTHPYTGARVESFSLFADRLGSVGSTTFVPVPGYYLGALYGTDESTHKLRELVRVCSYKYECLGTRMSGVTVAGRQAFETIDHSLWQSDSTPQGTKPHDVLHLADEKSFAVLGGRLVLGATSLDGERQLWETDGTVAGTRALSDGTLDQPFIVEGPPVPLGDALVVAAFREPEGYQLWLVAGGRATPLTALRHPPQ